MREAPVLRSHLWSLLADPAASPVERASAAVALAEGGREEHATGEKLRAMADAVASPKLRVVIEAAAEGSEAKLARALEQLDDADAATRVEERTMASDDECER